MASVFGHSIAAIALGKSAFDKVFDWKIGLLGAACACAPDLDVAGFLVGIKYSSEWGHRGFTHSLVFSAVFGWLVACFFYRKTPFFNKKALFLIVSTASHGLLDMLTDGGHGVALFWPFSSARHFFPWQPIAVSPLHPSDFRGEWMINVLQSELVWIGLPCVFVLIFKWLVEGYFLKR